MFEISNAVCNKGHDPSHVPEVYTSIFAATFKSLTIAVWVLDFQLRVTKQEHEGLGQPIVRGKLEASTLNQSKRWVVRGKLETGCINRTLSFSIYPLQETVEESGGSSTVRQEKPLL